MGKASPRVAGYRIKDAQTTVSETFIFMLVTVPILFGVIILSNFLAGEGLAFCLTQRRYFHCSYCGMRFTKNMFRTINRPAFNLLRAMNFESSTGYSVISEEIRTSVLCMYIMQRKPVAWQERMLMIVEENNELPKNWQLELPDFESHLDDIGFIEDENTPFWENDNPEPYEEE